GLAGDALPDEGVVAGLGPLHLVPLGLLADGVGPPRHPVDTHLVDDPGLGLLAHRPLAFLSTASEKVLYWRGPPRQGVSYPRPGLPWRAWSRARGPGTLAADRCPPPRCHVQAGPAYALRAGRTRCRCPIRSRARRRTA